MTEQEWLFCQDPQSMLDFLWEKSSRRKLQLFACGCCRRIWHLLTNPIYRRAVELGEQAADGLITHEQIEEEWVEKWIDDPAFGDTGGDEMVAALAATGVSVRWGLDEAYQYAISAATDQPYADDLDPTIPEVAVEMKAQSNLMRCIMGNPFGSIVLNPSWLAWHNRIISTVAQGIYDDHAFDRMPILADALEEAGCTNADILNHCRQPGEHMRGCWVVDLLLGKS